MADFCDPKLEQISDDPARIAEYLSLMRHEFRARKLQRGYLGWIPMIIVWGVAIGSLSFRRPRWRPWLLGPALGSLMLAGVSSVALAYVSTAGLLFLLWMAKALRDRFRATRRPPA
ncbi:MAG: hypothetical protein HY791_29920 [Deltaproteobacteria bacterium]|nr:hypothetical protein [Deltaproteobacteria bacterium]